MSIFRKSLLTIGNAGQTTGADLSDIDLTAATLDSRIKYQCMSSHAFIAADGTVQFASPDVWPLEYRDGIAIGRHEPEPQATNHNQYVANFQSCSAFVGNGVDYHGLPLFFCTFPEGNDKYIPCPTDISGAGTYTLSYYGLYNETTNAITSIGRPICYGMEHPSLDRTFAVNITTGETAVLLGDFKRITAQRFFDSYRCICSVSTDNALTQLEQRMMTAVTNTESGTQILGMPQIEAGEIATSPIITNGEPVTRADSSVRIKNPGRMATSVRVIYTDGTSKLFDFNGNDDVDIPAAIFDWGTRYISKCEYLKS
ncbi:hypothetical protein FFB58_00780 [Enterobacter sp. MF024]|uniref:phage head spike fiber domain-containing protein n=1 Tax=Enterobacter sp. MF024 TaxID=2555644 RepID=UPI001105878D|nr:hypothetical protein [Enterobacter sp. MF024]TLU69590.1 hypothetical protein FFB58_00780 [Enterobacter sp. MF024]